MSRRREKESGNLNEELFKDSVERFNFITSARLDKLPFPAGVFIGLMHFTTMGVELALLIAAAAFHVGGLPYALFFGRRRRK